MGKITEALKKVTDERICRIQKKPQMQYVVQKIKGTKIAEQIISFHDATSPLGEQYKILRTNIQSLNAAENYKTFVLTSSINGEGKTVTAINLAMAMACGLNNKSILLIDADMRKGKVSQYLGLNGSLGLSDVLKGRAEVDSVLLNPNVDNLAVLLAGKTPKNPAELLGSKKMPSLLAALKGRFDYIFIDSPPVMPLTDACILGAITDGVILIVQAGRTQRGVVKSAENRLYQARAKTLGCVMTNVEYHLPQYLYRYIQEYSEYKYENNGKSKVNSQ
jgi:succinoglycan biosynthesis transport protein ExoP